jgi:excisionase family DNA binding protein
MQAKKPTLRVDELATEWNCSEKTIRRLIHEKELDAFKLGNTWRIKRENADNFTKKNGQNSPD